MATFSKHVVKSERLIFTYFVKHHPNTWSEEGFDETYGATWLVDGVEQDIPPELNYIANAMYYYPKRFDYDASCHYPEEE